MSTSWAARLKLQDASTLGAVRLEPGLLVALVEATDAEAGERWEFMVAGVRFARTREVLLVANGLRLCVPVEVVDAACDIVPAEFWKLLFAMAFSIGIISAGLSPPIWCAIASEALP